MKGFGYLLGGFIKLWLMAKVDLHMGLAIGSLGIGIGSILLPFSMNRIYLAVITLLTSTCLFLTQVIITLCFMRKGKDHVKFYISLSYVCLNIGCFLGPYLVSIYGLFACRILGIALAGFGIAYFFFPKFPDEVQKNEETINNQISSQTQKYLCIVLVCYATSSLTIRSWLPSFSVMMKFQQKQDAALLLSILSITVTILTIISLFVKSKTLQIINFSVNGLIIFAPLVFIMYFLSFKTFLVIFSSVYFGFSTFLLYPCLCAVSDEFNKKLSSQNFSKMLTSYAIGETCLTFVPGYFMDLIHPMCMFVYLFAVALTMKYFINKCIESFKTSQTNSLEIPLQQMSKIK